MRKSSFFAKTKGMMYEYFIADLLNGIINDNTVVENRIKHLDWKLKRNFCVVVITDKQFDKENTPFNYIRTMLERTIGFSRSIEYDGSIVLIFNSNRETPICESDIKTLKEFLSKYNLYGGISHNFSNLIDVRKFYKQALTAIQIGHRIKEKTVLYYYKDFTIFDMFDICSTQRDLKDLCHPSLVSLIEYDKNYKTNYSETLYTYILNGQSQTKSANTLHIHRNTLNYRITKIAEIMGINLDDNTLMLHLHLSFKILEYVHLV
jgi:sugar diacid utilization regulator